LIHIFNTMFFSITGSERDADSYGYDDADDVGHASLESQQPSSTAFLKMSLPVTFSALSCIALTAWKCL